MQKHSTDQQKAFWQLMFAGVLWGFGFIGTVWALESLSPAAIVFYRFTGACVIGLLVFPRVFKDFLQELKPTFIIGLLLSLTLVLQTTGLQYTTATNSTFITILYVVIVPVIGALRKTERLPPFHFLWIILALAGTSLMIQLQEFKVNIGDLLTLACAFFAAFHILAIDKRVLQTRNPFAMNLAQSFWCGAMALPFLLMDSRMSLIGMTDKAWLGILSLCIGSSLIAFYLQIVAQKSLSPSIASLLFLLESPFSAFFAFLLLNERLTGTQLLGAALIFMACIAASIATARASRNFHAV